MITLEDVVEAFEKTGLTPRAGTMYVSDHSGCALGAILMANGGDMQNPYLATDIMTSLYGEYFDFERFGSGFDDGFLGVLHQLSYDPYFANGYEIGTRIRELFSVETVEEQCLA